MHVKFAVQTPCDAQLTCLLGLLLLLLAGFEAAGDKALMPVAAAAGISMPYSRQEAISLSFIDRVWCLKGQTRTQAMCSIAAGHVSNSSNRQLMLAV